MILRFWRQGLTHPSYHQSLTPPNAETISRRFPILKATIAIIPKLEIGIPSWQASDPVACWVWPFARDLYFRSHSANSRSQMFFNPTATSAKRWHFLATQEDNKVQELLAEVLELLFERGRTEP